jgi:hypothetical protein
LLGDILFMTQVTVKDDATGSKQERYLVLFDEFLLVLAASPRMSCFMYMVSLLHRVENKKKFEKNLKKI